LRGLGGLQKFAAASDAGVAVVFAGTRRDAGLWLARPMLALAAMRTSFSLVALVAGLMACGSGEPHPGRATPATPEPPEVLYGTVTERDRSGRADGADFTAVVAASNAFSLRVLGALRDASPERNVAVGGHSIHQVLGMLYAGARGKTAADMETALGWQVPADRVHATLNALDLELLSRGDDVRLSIANRMWAQKGLAVMPAFLDTLTRDYGAPLALADFAADPGAARAAINKWVERATGDKIPELFPAPAIHGLTRVVLANAMYLDAPWKYKLDPKQTVKAPFTRLDGRRVDVDMMHYDEFLPSAWDVDWQAVELPYRGDELAMVFIVPRDLRAFETRLTPERLQEVFDKIKHGGIHLSLPRLSFSFHASMKETLGGLGLASMFAGADFSGIAPGLSVEHFEHEVFLEVDEEGTRAAAATGAALPASHGPSVAVDRPFLFAIRDRPTGAVLFLGRVVDPRPAP
jgi:serpin B